MASSLQFNSMSGRLSIGPVFRSSVSLTPPTPQLPNTWRTSWRIMLKLKPRIHSVQHARTSCFLTAEPFSLQCYNSELCLKLKTGFVETIRNGHLTVLENARHDLAVSRGAAYYGMVRRGSGVRISAGLPRTYYIGVAVEAEGQPVQQGLTLMPAGAEPGHEVHLSEFEFQLTVATPVEFPLYYSGTRLTDQSGELVAIEREQMTALPPIRDSLTLT